MKSMGLCVACLLSMPLLFACGVPQPSQDSAAPEIAAAIFATQSSAAATRMPMTAQEREVWASDLDCYPLGVGDYWTWRWTSPEGSISQSRCEVKATRQMDGADVFVLRREWSTTPERYSEGYWSVMQGQVYWHGDDEYEAGALVKTRRPGANPILVWQTHPQVGEELQIASSVRVTGSNGGIYTYDRITHNVVEAVESVDVPAGYFEGCYRIRSAEIESQLIDTSLYWLCPGIGLTKMLTLEAIMEERVGQTMELIDYRVR